jgi:hypothetical protein
MEKTDRKMERVGEAQSRRIAQFQFPIVGEAQSGRIAQFPILNSQLLSNLQRI